MSVAIGGDETGGFIGDVGSAVAKFGFGGQDAPACVLGSRLGCVFDGATYAKRRGGESVLPELRELTAEDFELPEDYPARLHKRSPWLTPPQAQEGAAPKAWLEGDVPGLAAARLAKSESVVVRSPLVDGDYDDWDVVEELWERAFSRLTCKGRDQPVLAAYPSTGSPELRATYLELLFETFNCDATYLARNATLAAFAAGRASALVVDCGAGTTSVSPVVDGYVLHRGVRTSLRGGDHLDAAVQEGVAKMLGGQAATPRAALRNGGRATYDAWPPAFREFCARDCVRDLKQSCCVVPKGSHLAIGLKEDKKVYELPDGTRLEMTADLARTPERLFEAPARQPAPEAAAPAPAVAMETDENPPPTVVRDARAGSRPRLPPEVEREAPDPLVAALPEMVKTSLERVDVDVRKDLLLNILLTGGGSCFPGFSERLYQDVALSLCSPFKVKVLAPAPFERQFAVWIGGSILTSLGSFQQLWLSKREYEDDGPYRLLESRWD